MSELKTEEKPKQADLVDVLRLRNAQLEVEKAQLVLAALQREHQRLQIAFAAKYQVAAGDHVNEGTGEITRVPG